MTHPNSIYNHIFKLLNEIIGGQSGVTFTCTHFGITFSPYFSHHISKCSSLSWAVPHSHISHIHIFCLIQPLWISLCTCQRAGWCHSLFPFSTGTWHLLILTASLTCRVRQSLSLPVTLAVYTPSAPLCSISWCFNIKDPLFLFLYLLSCSWPLVKRFLDDSPIYLALWLGGQSWHSIS